MIIRRLLLPFKWIIIGVGEVSRGIYILLNKMILLLGSLFKYLYEGIIAISRELISLFKNVIFKYLVISIKYIFKSLELAFLGLFRFVKMLILSLIKILKFIVINTFVGIRTFIKGIYKIIYYVCKYIYIIFKTIFTYIYKVLKFVFVDVLGKAFKAIGNFMIKVFKFIGLIPLYIWNGIRWVVINIYKAIIFPFVYVRDHFADMIKQTIKTIKENIDKASKFIVNLPKKIKDDTLEWVNNLSFVKDIKNRREMKRQALMIDFDAEDSERSEKKVLYRYVAKHPDGKIEKGKLGAFSKLDVHSYLLAEGYEVYEIKPFKGVNLSFGSSNYKINVNELVFFLTQLSTYIKAGIPLVDSIKILAKQSKKSNIKTVYNAIIYDLTMGDNFSEALDKQGISFPRLLVNMVKSSELAGNLSETLDDMADYYTSVSKTRKQMKSAMTYPTVIFIFAVCVIVFILTFVIPTFIDMYKDADAEVPALTTTIINISDFLISNAPWLIIGVIAIIAGLYFMYKNVKVFRLIVQWLLMHTPIIGNIIIYNEVAMFSKTFASLWNHNVFITSSMEILSKITENEIYKMLIFDAITNVARGEAVSNSFKNNWAFPVVAYEMLLTGERTGQPGPMMDKVADYYQEEHRNAINQIKAFIEPAMIIFLAIVVGIILLSVIIPMFGMYNQLDIG